jgi:hypothetical protein
METSGTQAGVKQHMMHTKYVHASMLTPHACRYDEFWLQIQPFHAGWHPAKIHSIRTGLFTHDTGILKACTYARKFER